MCKCARDDKLAAAAKSPAIIYLHTLFIFLGMFLQFTWLSEADVEVVSHGSAGVRRDWTVAVVPCPLDQGLWPRWQALLGGFGHVHQSLRVHADTHGIRGLWRRKQSRDLARLIEKKHDIFTTDPF